ncbi:MAG: hypothetical protein AB1715_11680 [Acidobacteriota bacterium]
MIHMPPYYTGLTDLALIREREGTATTHKIDRDYTVSLRARISPRGLTWFVIESNQR